MRSDRTLFYPLEARGVGTADVESLRSYVERLTLAHRLKPRSLLHELVNSSPALQKATAARHLGEGWYVHGTGEVAQLVAKALTASTTVDVEACSLARFSSMFCSVGLTRQTPLYCPVCVAEPSPSGLPYGRLLWVIAGVEACPKHRVRLRSSDDCGAPDHERLSLRARPAVQGVCSSCGSVGFKCQASCAAEAATPEEVSVAEQVGKLVALNQTQASAMTGSSLMLGIRAALDECFEGKPVNAALAAGLSRSTVWSWLKEGRLPSLMALLKFCAASKCDLVATMSGSYQRLNRCQTQVAKPRRYRRNGLSDEELRRAISTAAASNPPVAGIALAKALNLDVKMLRTRFPQEYGVLQERRRAHWDQEVLARRTEHERKFHEAAQVLIAEGRPVTRKAVQRMTGVRAFGHDGNRGIALDNVLRSLPLG